MQTRTTTENIGEGIAFVLDTVSFLDAVDTIITTFAHIG